MSEHPVAMHGTRQLFTPLLFLASLIAVIFALSLFSIAQGDFQPNLPLSQRPNNGEEVPNPPHRSDQVWQFKSGSVPLHMPQKLYQCEAGQCGTWVFNGATGEGRWPNSGAIANLTVEKFDLDGIIIHRRDVRGNTPGLTALYTGKIVGNQIKGEVTWTWAGFGGRSPHTVWGATVQAPTDYSILDPSLPCKSYVMSSEEALYRGTEAMNANRYDAGICWMRIAADKGNAEAEGVLSVVYYKGYHVIRNIREATKYAQEGAAAGNAHAEGTLWRMYEDGTFPRDSAKASYWEAKFKADQITAEQTLETQKNDEIAFQKEAMGIQNVNEAAMNKVIQQRQQQQNVAGELMLGILLGALIGDVAGGSDSTAQPSQSDTLIHSWQNACAAGNSDACHHLGNSDDDH